MNIWIVMIAVGLLTFLTRLSFIAWLERIRLPDAFQRALRFVPTAVLSAIIAPEVVLRDHTLFLSIQNPRLLAALLATLAAYYTKNVVWSLLVGMVAFWLLQEWM